MPIDAACAGLLRFSPMDHPALSVIVPVRDGAHFLADSLPALRASDLPKDRWELIVVDDSSRDRSAEIAACYADRVVRLVDGARGPAAARNRGAEVARADKLMFVDADVCVHADALRRVVEIFERESDVSAVFGAYDSAPAAGGLISQYRNLVHRYVHLRGVGNAETFWAGCGAIRAEVFARCGGFDEALVHASIEDIELGYRMSALGYRIVLDPEVQSQHLKRWTLWSMIVTDVRHRGIPWMRVLMSRNMRPAATLNIRVSEQVCTGLVLLGCLAVFGWWWSGAVEWLAVAAGALVVTVAINAPLFNWLARQRGWGFALGALPLRLLTYVLNLISVSLALLPFRFGQKPGPQRRGRIRTGEEPAHSTTRN